MMVDEQTGESAPLPPIRIVISYRRQDTPGGAGRLREMLANHFGSENVFLDIDMIPPGVDWVEAIEKTVSDCDVLLPLIGLHWLNVADDRGRRRLDDPNDVLRFEIETALKARVGMIPIQLHGAVMPSPDELPESLVGLTRRQSIRIDDDDWPHDVQRLVRALERIQREKAEALSAQAAEKEAAEEQDWREAKRAATRGRIVHMEIPAENTQRAMKFWGELAGLTFQRYEGPVEYNMFEGQPGGGIYPALEGEKGIMLYFETDDIDAELERIRDAGGNAEDKMAVPNMGWFAHAKDTEGNEFSVWQSDESAPAPGDMDATAP